MAIRVPLKGAFFSDNSSEVGAGSVGGGVPLLFTIPQDTDNITLKFTASTAGGGVSAQLQTTDDGGTTWFGLGRTSIVSNAVGDNVQWLSIPVAGYGVSSASVVATGSVVSGNAIGSAQPSTVSVLEVTGLPVLSQQGRVLIQITGSLTAAASNIIISEVKVNSQSATA